MRGQSAEFLRGLRRANGLGEFRGRKSSSRRTRSRKGKTKASKTRVKRRVYSPGKLGLGL